MRDIIFRGKNIDLEWVEGDLLQNGVDYKTAIRTNKEGFVERVISHTVGQYTGLTDKNDKKIFEGDIVQYLACYDWDCQSIVKFGEYKQDGSGGEYGGRKCIGFYVEVDNFTCPDWCEDDPECFPNYARQQNILEVFSGCEVIGNIYDNPELIGE